MSAAKRAFDLVGAIAGILVLSPLFILVAIWIKTDDGGAVFFRHTRVGRHGREFRMWKFRTMVVDAERRGGSLTVGRDARITRVGRRLRAWKIDELPQLLNVLAGNMSLVGPRPEVPEYVARYDRDQRKVLELMPGLTDPASIRFNNEAELLAGVADPQKCYVDEILPEKIRFSLSYAERATILTDLAVILRTLRALRRPGSPPARGR